jgi:hypothetical protein
MNDDLTEHKRRMLAHAMTNNEDINPFAEMLRVMDIPELIRFRARFKKTGRLRMVEILTDEIEERKFGDDPLVELPRSNQPPKQGEYPNVSTRAKRT